MNFSLGRCLLELAQELSRVALALHKAGSSTPFWVTICFLTLKYSTHDCVSKELILSCVSFYILIWGAHPTILAEGAIALSVTLSGGALFAS